ncbi:hypothetical protein WA588_002790, partial [Blastocystis sp. NMH]
MNNDDVVFLPLDSYVDANKIGDTQEQYGLDDTDLSHRSGFGLLSFLGLSSESSSSSDSAAVVDDNEEYPELQADDYGMNSTVTRSFIHVGEKACRLEITNILPENYMPRRPIPKENYQEEAKYRRAYQSVDADIVRSERDVSSSSVYLQMRSAVMEDKEVLYPSDHLSIKYTRHVYINVSERERFVINALYHRMNESKCLQPVVAKYQKMTSDLTIDRESLWNQTKQMVTETRRRAGQLSNVTDEMVEEAFRNEQYEKKKERLEHYYSVDYRSSSKKYCDGCFVLSQFKFYTAVKKYPKHYLIRKWVGNEETEQIYTNANAVYPDSDVPFNVTAIAAATYNRLFSIQQLLYRWRGNLVVVLQCPDYEEQSVIQFINTHYFPPRFTLILFLTDDEHVYSTSFPVNYLRNLAIRNIRTTHFLVMDMDLRLTTNTYDEVMRLPKQLLKSQNSVFILPVFFYNHTLILNNCNSIDECAALANEYQPENKAELVACLYQKNCISNKRLVRTHMYIMPEWYLTREKSPASRIRCFLTDFMEPYMLVKYQETTPLFHEEFVDYGYNKVQYFENLRQMGSTFYILNHAFAMDFPHPDSDFRIKYHNIIHSDEENPMKEVYNRLQRRFNQRYQHIRSSRVCFHKQDSYYQEL